MKATLPLLLFLLPAAYAQSYKAVITWNDGANPSDPTTGFNVYRAFSGDKWYALMNGAPLPASTPTYTDTTVATGADYLYYVTALDAANVSSLPSNTWNTGIIGAVSGQTTGSFTPGEPLAFYPVAPCRVVDTRNAAGPLGGPPIGGTTSRNFPVLSSPCGIPSTAQAYSLNVTALPHNGTLNYLTIWPTGTSQPNVSTLNSPAGQTIANAAIVPAGTSGQVTVFVTDTSDVILDINGYFAPVATP